MQKLFKFLLMMTITLTLGAQNKVIFNSTERPRETEIKRAEISNPETENNPNWNLLFDYGFGGGSTVGGYQGATFVEATGTFWVSDAAVGYIYEYSKEGELVDSFYISGVNGITGMTCDDTYVYAVICDYYIYKINPVTHSLAGTINPYGNFALVTVGYDPDANNGNGGLWTNMWGHDIILVDMQGNYLDEIPYSNIYPSKIYGIAYDNVTEGGPYLWAMDFNNSWNSPQYVIQYDLATKMPTGFSYTVTDDIGVGENYRAGQDLFLTTSAFDGIILLGGVVTGIPEDHLFGYDIGTTMPQSGPGFASNPMPEPYAVEVMTDNMPTLMWDNPSEATSNKVYFGTNLGDVASSNPAALVADGSSGSLLYTEYDAGMLEFSTTYYWRVVEFENTDSTLGRLWRFSTRMEPAPKKAENVMAMWNESGNSVNISWHNPAVNIYNEPVAIDSAYIYADEIMIGKTFGEAESFVWHNPQSGIFSISVVVFDDNFMSEMSEGYKVGVNVYVTTFNMNNLNTIIPDDNMTPLRSPVTIPETDALIEKIIVSIDTIMHSFVSDLDIYLEAPDGMMVELSTDNGGSGDDIINMVLDDDAVMPVQGSSAPFTGTFYPEEPLANFMNMEVKGEWNLYILDDYNIDEGTLQAWSITFVTTEPLSGTQQPGWDLPIMVYNTSIGEQVLNIGEASNATDGIDPALGENTLPPMPPLDIFDARFVLPVSPIEYTWKDYRNSSNPENEWKLKIQSESGSYPVTLMWDTTAIPESIGLELMDAFTGNLINVDMRSTNMVMIDNPSITELHIHKSELATMTMPVYSGWNIVSVPMHLESMMGYDIFQNVSTDFYGYDGGYFTANELSMGKGYWVKIDENSNVEMTGSIMYEDYIMLEEGWNLLAVHHYDVMADMIYTEPAGILESAFFGFDETYYPADELHVCAGYWVRASQAGKLYLPAYSPAKRDTKPEKQLPENKIVISDVDGKSFTLYLAENGYSGNKQLPPPPPAGAADVRFDDDTFISDKLNSSIKFSSLQFPVTIKVSGKDLRISDPLAGRFVNSVVRDGESITISNSGLNSLLINTVEVPTAYSLEQNYPNPFNPATTIKFSLPEKQNVTITVYNALGELVRNVVSAEFEAGHHTINFNASDLSSGVYIYRIQAGKFSNVRKMMLLK